MKDISSVLIRSFFALVICHYTLLAQTKVTTVEIPGARSVHITGINNSGDVTGYYCQDDNCRGFVRGSSGTITTFQGIPNAINDAGTIVGHIQNKGGFIRDKEGIVIVFNAFEDPTYNYTWVMAINNRGEVAGYQVRIFGDVCRLFIRDRKGILTNIVLPEGLIPSGINGRGDLTGYNSPYFFARNGYLIERNGTVTMFSVPEFDATLVGTVRARPTAMNNSGDIAGYYSDPNSKSLRGFLRDKEGTFTKFDGIPVAMNERGDVAGYDLSGASFIRDANSGVISIFSCPGLPTSINTGYGEYGMQSISMNNRGDVAGGNVICSPR
jgi:hypothetical protein